MLVFQSILIPVAGGILLSGRWEHVMISDVRLGGISLEGMTPRQAREHLQERMPPVADRMLKLTAGGKVWEVAYKDIKAGYALEGALKKAFAVGHTGPAIRRFTEIVRSDDSKDIQLPLQFDQGLLREKLNNINYEYKNQFSNLPKNARLSWRDGKVEVIPSVPGCEIDVASTLEKLTCYTARSDEAVPMAVAIVKPRISEMDLYGIKNLIGYYNTTFDPGRQDRAYNIMLAGRALDGVLLKPGEEFSFNSVIGSIDRKSGYKKATVIMGNKLLDDYGGGVCQVTTTLYNAGLLAGVEVVEHHNHSIPVSYVGPGLDAAIAQGNAIDFRFRNSSSHAQYISCGVDTVKGNVEVWIFGISDQKANV
jgi:vancomycin resistance protein YoaR